MSSVDDHERGSFMEFDVLGKRARDRERGETLLRSYVLGFSSLCIPTGVAGGGY